MDFIDILNDHDLDDIAPITPKSSSHTGDEKLISSFNEISEFFDSNEREPNKGGDWREHSLAARLDGFRQSTSRSDVVRHIDRHNLLGEVQAQNAVKTFDEILEDDDLGILGGEDIYKLKYVKPYSNIEKPTHFARREKCENFIDFEPLFDECKLELANNDRMTTRFSNETQIGRGDFFILNGILVYVNAVNKLILKKGKTNARLHLIFDNGTESDMLMRSLATELYKDENGRRVIKKIDTILDQGNNSILDDDQFSGVIYVLKSLTKNSSLSLLKDLYKIGYTRGSIDKRISNAKNDPTYLMAGVKKVAEYKCYNMNPQKFEKLLHRFFSEVKLDVIVKGFGGAEHDPREWFVVPFSEIDKAIELILNGEIIDYQYCPKKMIIIPITD